MNIKSKSYKKIMDEYARRRQRNQRLAEERRMELGRQVPRIREIEAEMADLSSRAMERSLTADAATRSSIRRELAQHLDVLRAEKASLASTAPGVAGSGSYGSGSDISSFFDCPLCLDTGYINGSPCSCLRQALADELYSQSHIRDILLKENFTSLTMEYYNDEERCFFQGLISELKSFVSSFDSDHRSLLFTGNTGSGKTFMSNCLSKELLDAGYSVIYFTAHQLFEYIARRTFSPDRDEEDASDFLEDIFDCDLLVIDDLGSELSNAFVSSRLFLILNERHLRERSTLISTNLDLQQINDLYSERCTSRLLEDFNFYSFKGRDMRPFMRRRIRAV